MTKFYKNIIIVKRLSVKNVGMNKKLITLEHKFISEPKLLDNLLSIHPILNLNL